MSKSEGNNTIRLPPAKNKNKQNNKKRNVWGTHPIVSVIQASAPLPLQKARGGEKHERQKESYVIILI